MKAYTVDEMLACNPCLAYNRARITKLWAGREALSALDFIDLDIPHADKMWALCLPETLTPEQNQAWIDVFVTRAITDHALTSAIPAVVEWAERWISGADRSRAAAEAVTEAVTEAAVWAAEAAVWAAWAAAEAAEAAEAVTEAAVWAAGAAEAAWAATEAVTEAAAEAAEEKQQLEDLRAILIRDAAGKGERCGI